MLILSSVALDFDCNKITTVTLSWAWRLPVNNNRVLGEIRMCFLLPCKEDLVLHYGKCGRLALSPVTILSDGIVFR